MRCSCQRCGTYMVQDEKGESSRCICPECFLVCTACMGTGGQPLSPDALRDVLFARACADSERGADDDGYGEEP